MVERGYVSRAQSIPTENQLTVFLQQRDYAHVPASTQW